MSRHRTSCRQIRRRIALIAAGHDDASDRGLVRHHTAQCAPCQEYHHRLEALAAQLRRWEASTREQRPSEAAARRWEQAIRDCVQPHPCHWGRPTRWWPAFPSWQAAGRMAVAAIWLLVGCLRFSAPPLQPSPPMPGLPTLTQLRLVLGQPDYPLLTGSMGDNPRPADRPHLKPTGARRSSGGGATRVGDFAGGSATAPWASRFSLSPGDDRRRA